MRLSLGGGFRALFVLLKVDLNHCQIIYGQIGLFLLMMIHPICAF
jgi:hypothetical protein